MGLVWGFRCRKQHRISELLSNHECSRSPSEFPYLRELVIGLIKSDLEILDFLSEVSDITVSLVGLEVVFLGGILELPDGGVQTVGLALEALHLLPDGVHGAGAGGLFCNDLLRYKADGGNKVQYFLEI